MRFQNYFCAYEGQQESLYLKHVAKLIKEYNGNIVRFNGTEGDAVKLTKSTVDYDKVCLFDHDFKQAEFERNLKLCIELNSKKKKSDGNVHHAYSNICFDLWLLLHKKFVGYTVSKATGYADDVRKTYSLSSEADIKSESVIGDILAQISLDDVKNAIRGAERLRLGKLEQDRIFVLTDFYYPQPDFSIDIFLKMVLGQAGVKFT